MIDLQVVRTTARVTGVSSYSIHIELYGRIEQRGCLGGLWRWRRWGREKNDEKSNNSPDCPWKRISRDLRPTCPRRRVWTWICRARRCKWLTWSWSIPVPPAAWRSAGLVAASAAASRGYRRCRGLPVRSRPWCVCPRVPCPLLQLRRQRCWCWWRCCCWWWWWWRRWRRWRCVRAAAVGYTGRVVVGRVFDGQ